MFVISRHSGQSLLIDEQLQLIVLAISPDTLTVACSNTMRDNGDEIRIPRGEFVELMPDLRVTYLPFTAECARIGFVGDSHVNIRLLGNSEMRGTTLIEDGRKPKTT